MENNRNSGEGRKFDLLDKWLKQTLHISKSDSNSTPNQGALNATSNNGVAQPTQNQAAQGNKNPQNAAIHNNQRTQGVRHSQHAQNKTGNTGGPTQKPGHGKRQGQHPKKNRFRKKQGHGNAPVGGDRWNRGHFNQRHKFHSALKTIAPATQQKPILHDPRGVLKIVPIGGLDEVGKNTMVMEYEDSIFLIDLGFQFPEADMLGVDYVIPDITYLKDRVKKIKGIVITHGHLDHIGAIPYLLPKLGFPPIYAGKLAVGLIKKQLEEHGLLGQADIRTLNFSEVLHFGKMRVSFFRVTHSIPDSCGLFIETPAGSILHTGDFKIDLSPAGIQKPPDFMKIAGFAAKNVTIMMSDSTNAIKPGFTVSERKIGRTLDKIVKDAEGRVIIASFSSQIGRIQQIIDAAVKYHKKIYLSGRSLIDNVAMAQEIGYLKFPQGLFVDIRKAKKNDNKKAIILTTGSQGEPVSALSRMALNEHAHIQIDKGDTVVLSSSPIPGNEMAVVRVINNLVRLGANVIHNHIMDVHASGHGQQEDLKLMFSLVRPKYFVPIHGEYFMRKTHGDLMVHDLGFPNEKMLMIENGDILEVKNGEVKVSQEKAETKYILIDGMGRGDIGSQVMMDRQVLAENGVVVVGFKVDKQSGQIKGGIEIDARGFVYMEESQEILDGIKKHAEEFFMSYMKEGRPVGNNREELKLNLKAAIDGYVISKIDRTPLVVPVFVEV